jgi:hypothetical protein
MRKIWLLMVFGLMSTGLFAQFDYTTMPDTVPNLGSRKAIRDLNNWNALHNAADGDSIDSLRLSIQTLESSSIPDQTGNDGKYLQSSTGTLRWWPISTGEAWIRDLNNDTLGSNLNAFILVQSDLRTTLGPAVRNVASSLSIPTFTPHVGWSNSGLGGNGFGDVALIRGGSTRFSTDAAGNYLYSSQFMPDLTGSGTGTSIVRYNRATGELTYADDAGGTSFTFGNGLNETGGAVTLGDTITQSTYITNDGESYSFQIRSAFSGGGQSSRFTVGGGAMSMQGWGNGTYNGGGTYSLAVDGHRSVIATTNEAADLAEIRLDTTQMRIRDDINLKGLEAYADYSTNYTDYSYVSKKWVSDNFSGGGSAFTSLTADTIDDNGAGFILSQSDIRTELGAKLLNEAASLTNPTLIPHQGWITSGIGGDGFGDVAIVRGGVTRFATDASGNFMYNNFFLPDISGTGTGTSILLYNRATGDVTYGDEVGTAYTASNGLTLVTTDFQLGGALTANTDLSGAYTLNIGETLAPLTLIEITSSTGSSIGLSDGADDQKYITITNASMLVADVQDTKGLEYGADYSTNWTDHSLVTKKWVTDNFSDITGDTIVIDSVAWMLSDTLDFRFGLGIGHPNDTASFFDGAYAGGWYNFQDTVVCFETIADIKGASADVDWRIVYSATKYDASPTVVTSGTVTTAGGTQTSTTFTNKFIPPNVNIWGEVDGAPAVKGIQMEIDLGYGKTR